MELQSELRQFPFIRLCIYYISGIFAAYTGTGNLILIVIIGLAVVCFLIFFKTRISQAGLVCCIVVFLAGAFSYIQAKNFTKLPEVNTEYGCILAKPIAKKAKTIQADCRIYRIHGMKTEFYPGEKLRLYLVPDSIDIPEIGDTIIVTGIASRIKNAGNPQEFDYARYLSNERISYSIYADTAHYKVGNNSGKYCIKRIADRVQRLSVRKLEAYGFEGDELAVLVALTSGGRDLLTDKIISDYAATGALHVLSVSGLHVGILFMFLNFLFGNRNNRTRFRIIRFICIFLIIWFYAFITGLSSPVLRSSVMFSLFLTGKNFRRNCNSYNVLAASAFIILAINPLELFKVGFQFSYLAVLGILFFQPRLEILLEMKSLLFDRIWQLITVSIAAQLVTVPLSLYYFHQFPVYFLLTNLIVIPLTWLIMMLSVAFYILLPIPLPAEVFAFILKWLLKILNRSIDIISNLPYSVISNIRFEDIHLAGWSLFIIFFSLYLFFWRRNNLLYLSVFLILVMLIFDFFNYWKSSEKAEIIVYNMREAKAISLIYGHNHYLITEGIADTCINEQTQYLQNFWISRQILRGMKRILIDSLNDKRITIEDQLLIEPDNLGTRLVFQEKQILLVNRGNRDFPKVMKNETTYYVISKDSGYPSYSLMESVKPGKTLILLSLSKYQKQQWIDFAEEQNLKIHDMENDGAYKILSP